MYAKLLIRGAKSFVHHTNCELQGIHGHKHGCMVIIKLEFLKMLRLSLEKGAVRVCWRGFDLEILVLSRATFLIYRGNRISRAARRQPPKWKPAKRAQTNGNGTSFPPLKTTQFADLLSPLTQLRIVLFWFVLRLEGFSYL